MSARVLLRDKLAPAVGRVILKHALGADAVTITGPFLDWLAARFKDHQQARRANNFARDVANVVVEALVPIFERDHTPDLNLEAVALALGKTLDDHVDGRFLAAHDLDPKRLIKATLALRPLTELKQQAYATSDIALYERVLPTLIEALVARAKEFRDFEIANAAEVLKRLRKMDQDLRRTGEGVGYLFKAQQVWERRRASDWHAFERDYADAVLDRWNKLELFGIDVSNEVQRKQKLSVAYIQLNLQSAESDDPSTGSLVSFEELLAGCAESGRPLVILGEAGGGKTTLLRWAACHAVDRQLQDDLPSPFADLRRERFGMRPDEVHKPEKSPKLAWWARVPFFIRLRNVKNGLVPKEHAWPATSAALPRDPPDGWLDEILGGGHGLILLDGLDELGSEGRDVVRATLRSILRDRRGNLVLLTSRPGAFDPDWFDDVPLQVATIRAMSPGQRDACVTNWHEAVARTKVAEAAEIRRLGSELAGKIRRSPYLQEPTTNPLICAATCALHYGRRGYLPAGLVDLFDALCRMLIHDRDEQRQLIEGAHVPDAYRRLDLAPKRQILEDMAAEMVLNRRSEWSCEAALICVKERLASIPAHREAKPEDVLEGLLLRSGVLRPAGEDAVDFLHNAFKEYLAAARFLARRSHPYLIEAADRDPGDRVFAYAYAIASSRGDQDLTKELIDGLLDRQEPVEIIVRHRQILALRCSGLTVSAAGSVLDRFDRLIDDVLPPRDAPEAEAIATLGDKVVTRLGRSEDAPEIAAACAHALVSMGTTSAHQALEAFKATEHKTVATELAFAFNPLELPFWLAQVTTMRADHIVAGLPDAVAQQVTDLAPLSGLTDIRDLLLDNTAVADLTPLQGLTSLQTLSLDNTAVADLTPLQGLTALQRLTLNNTAVADLTPLQALTSLKWLQLDNTAVADLTPLQALTSLQELFLDNTAVALLTPLQGLTAMQRLTLNNTAVTDLTPLQALISLEWLTFNDTTVADLTPLQGLTTLEWLFVDSTAVADLTPLQTLTSLRRLYLSNTAVAELTQLRHLTGLQVLALNNTAIADLTPLQGLTGLQELYLSDTAVADLSPLQALTRLQELSLDNTAVADLIPLQALTDLRRLTLDYTEVADLTPLQALTGLAWLSLDHTAVADLTPLQALTGLQLLSLDHTAVADLIPVEHIKDLQILGSARERRS